MSSNITPIISVIVPIYNLEASIERCLTSILKSTYRNYEIICINDGSTDNTEEILFEYAKSYPNIHILTQPNKGTGPARNLGLTYAQGKYLIFIDGDDFVHPQYFEILMKLQEETKADITVCEIEEVRSIEQEDVFSSEARLESTSIRSIVEPSDVSTLKTDFINTSYRSNLEQLDLFYIDTTQLTYRMVDIREAMKKGYLRCYCTGRMYRRDAIRDVTFPPIVYTEDTVYNIHAMGSYPKLRMALSPLPLYYYVYREDSASHSNSKLRRADAIPYYLKLAEMENDPSKERIYLEYGIKQILQCRYDSRKNNAKIRTVNIDQVITKELVRKFRKLLIRAKGFTFFEKVSYFTFLTLPKTYEVYRCLLA